MHGWVALLGSFLLVALILVAFGLMLGIVKPGDALRRVGVIVSVAIVLFLIPGILVSAWSAISLWQQIALIAIGVVLLQLSLSNRQRRYKRER
jgi:hypothetical protein